MAKQSDLIGNHPSPPHMFATWLACTDPKPTTTKSHRQLSPLIDESDTALITWLGKILFDHHHSQFRIERLKENYKKLGFAKYANQHRQLPKVDKTKKGNAAEVILTEYIQTCLNRPLEKVFKLRYNPNVDQAIKGDDTLLVDVIKKGKSTQIKIYLGESKFRKTPSKSAIKQITDSLAKDKLPLSYTFLVEQLAKDPAKASLATLLDGFIVKEIKRSGNLIYTGLLLSNRNTGRNVELHLNSNNKKLVLISLSLKNPSALIDKSFKQAEHLFLNPSKI